ncbi:g5056 [Coccomyxa viridis]|uniref:G5056 protein n=1 Tax=Coccomyxa viridis TaxID=1274662 RepID=A0ABP1FU45_9CHLO
MNRYIKKKSLDPLETYVPAVIQAREQLVDAGKLMVQDPIEARIRLRSSAFEGLRDNIRALGEYATTNNAASERAAKDLVNRTFGTIQDFDFQLFSANRNKEPVGKEAETKLEQAISAMDDLLATVPADSMSKAREVLKSIESRALARSNGDAVEAYDEQMLQRLVPDAP